MTQTLTHHPAACAIAFLSLVVLTFVANRLGLIFWFLVRDEGDRHKEKRESEATDEYWKVHR